MSELHEKLNDGILRNPKQFYGIYKYSNGATVLGLITQTIRDAEARGELKILKEWEK